MTGCGETAADAHLPSVSVVIPARDSEATIVSAIDSVLSQDYAGPMEVIVADGSCRSATSEAIRRHHPTVRLVPNPERTIGFGINAALRVTTGKIIVRCDAHTSLTPGYVRRAVETLERTGAVNVGGIQRPVGTTFFERAAAVAMSSAFGVGDARHRLGGVEGPSDTAYLGVLWRETLDAVGGYDSSLLRNQDYELNWRLRKRGGTVWFDPALVVDYRPRSTLRKLASQYFDYGRWKRMVLRRHPASLRPRHLAAPLLVSGLAISAFLVPAGVLWAAALPLAYLFALAAGSLALGIRCREPAALILPLVLGAMHLGWGTGFFFPVRA